MILAAGFFSTPRDIARSYAASRAGQMRDGLSSTVKDHNADSGVALFCRCFWEQGRFLLANETVSQDQRELTPHVRGRETANQATSESTAFTPIPEFVGWRSLSIVGTKQTACIANEKCLSLQQTTGYACSSDEKTPTR